MAKIPVAVQLYSVRTDCAQDFPGTLRKVAQMGYDGVEFAGYYNCTAADLRRMLDDNGLKVAGTHIGIQTLLGDELQKSIDFNAAIGNKFLIVPGLPGEYRDSAAAWRRTADTFNAIAEKLAPHGMYTGYHNHTHEFTRMDGQVPWEILFGNTGSRVVMQADTGNAMHGGADVLPYLEKYPGRARTVHLKEFSKTNATALVGEGSIDWARCFKLCETVGATEWYIVEQEQYPVPPLDAVEKCLANVKKIRNMPGPNPPILRR
jgi:sugar phosphate isomerase/epimerase